MENENNPIFQMRFPQKLCYLLNTNSESILWGGTGRTILLNYKTLDSYLRCGSSIFKTTHISSFIRQLNLYGFRKVTSHLQDPLCNSSNPDMHEYIHDLFQFGRPELLNKIKRKTFNVKKPHTKACMFNVCETRLQKARKALRTALRKASQDLFSDKPERYLSFKNPQSNGIQMMKEFTKLKMPTVGAEIPMIFSEYIEEKRNEDWQMHVTNDEAYKSNDYASKINCDPPEDPIANYYSNCEGNTDTNKENDLPSPKSEERSIDDYFILPHSQEEGNIIIEVFNQEHAEHKEDSREKVNHGPSSLALPSFDSIKRLYRSAEVNYKEELYGWKCKTPEEGSIRDEVVFKEREDVKPVEIASMESCGSELKELYYEISKTIDLLNN